MQRSLFLLPAFILISFPALAHDHAHTQDHQQESDAQDTGLMLGGHITSLAGFVNEDADEDTRPQTFFTETEVDVQYRQRADAGFYYGAYLELEADVSEDAREEGVNADKTYIFIESGLGRFEMGSQHDAGHLFGIDASTIARATGGIHGDWDRFATFPGGGHSHGGGASGGHSHSFIDSPSLPLHHEHGESEDALKVSYISPSYGGFQFGISYLPDSGDVGQDTNRNKTGHRDFNDVFNGGVQFSQQYGDFAYALSAIGETGNAEVSGHQDLEAYAFGASTQYKGFALAGSYTDWGTSLNHSEPDVADGGSWSLGAAYNHGPAGASLTYLNAEYQRNETEALSLGADYILVPGLTPFVEFTWFDFNAADPDEEDNNGVVSLLGMQLSF